MENNNSGESTYSFDKVQVLYLRLRNRETGEILEGELSSLLQEGMSILPDSGSCGDDLVSVDKRDFEIISCKVVMSHRLSQSNSDAFFF